MKSKIDVFDAIKGRFYKSLVLKCQLISNANLSRAPMNLQSSAEYLIIYGIFIVWNQVFLIHVVFLVAHGTTPTFKVSGDMIETNMYAFLRCI